MVGVAQTLFQKQWLLGGSLNCSLWATGGTVPATHWSDDCLVKPLLYSCSKDGIIMDIRPSILYQCDSLILEMLHLWLQFIRDYQGESHCEPWVIWYSEGDIARVEELCNKNVQVVFGSSICFGEKRWDVLLNNDFDRGFLIKILAQGMLGS